MNILRKIIQIAKLAVYIFTKKNYKDFIAFAQAGEDRILRLLFYTLGKSKITYLDIGTNHPIHFNNTFLFYVAGSRGVCVEANPNLIAEIKNKRPEDICLNIGIGKENAEALDFYIFDSSDEAKGLSTFSPEDVKHVESVSNIKVAEIKKIPVQNINEVFAKYFPKQPPDLISIDVEGLDFDIIKCIDLHNYRPCVFCVETVSFLSHGENVIKNEMKKHFNDHGYKVYAETGINTIFIDSKIK
jgi:FkbM family methyltransferase